MANSNAVKVCCSLRLRAGIIRYSYMRKLLRNTTGILQASALCELQSRFPCDPNIDSSSCSVSRECKALQESLGGCAKDTGGNTKERRLGSRAREVELFIHFRAQSWSQGKNNDQ